MAEPGAPAVAESCEQHIVLRPNRSLSQRAACLLVCAGGFWLAVFAGFFVVTGAWPVVPFLGAEFLVFASALWVLRRHAGDCEVISLARERLQIVKRVSGRETSHEFPRCWTNVDVVRDGAGARTARVFVRLRERRVEVGAALGEPERLQLAQALRRALGPRGSGGADVTMPVGESGFFA